MRLSPLLILLVLVLPASAADRPLTFERHVRPILKAHCFDCHGEGSKLKAGLDLRLARLIKTGGESGAAIEPGRPAASLLIERVTAGEMPPGESKKLTAEQIAVLSRWIAAGARTIGPEPEKLATGFQFSDADRRFWAWQPVVRPPLPTLEDSSRVRNPIDLFVQARLAAAGHRPAADAARRTLLRRACLDLLGLPPTLDQLDRFQADRSPGAWQRLVDRLLASPHHGERWGRHWLDAAGYADSEGVSNTDPVRKWAWQYRDWVIDAHNADQAWDRFLVEQLAGDELVKPPYTNLPPERLRLLTATGYLRNAPDGTVGDDSAAARNQVMAETIKIVSTSLLGLTVGCAQCHNHRYDPIPQADYYRLRAILEPALNVAAWKKPAQRLVTLYTDADRAEAAKIEVEAKKIDAERSKKQEQYIQQTFDQEVAKLAEDLRQPARQARETPAAKRTDEQKTLLKTHPSLNVSAGSLYLYDPKAADKLKAIAKRAGDLRATKPAEMFVRVLAEVPGQVPTTRLFFRGDIGQPREELQPAGLSILAAATSRDAVIAKNDERQPSTGRRLAWARRLTDGRHPLVARVIVNRAWMHHFGRGLVSTPGDFGALGQLPSHPELLDWLAGEFVATGWSLKRLHRLILTSTTYRQSSLGSPELVVADPDNRLLGRMSFRRLDAEALRDSMLSVSGSLNTKRYGPPVPIMADRVGQWVIGKENLNAGRPGAAIAMNGEEFRRSIWVQVRRSRPLGVLDTFDRPAMQPNCTERVWTTVSSQSLMMMNSDLVVSQSERFAARLRARAGEDTAAQVRLAWQLAFVAEATDEETSEAVAFLDDQEKLFADAAAKDDKPKAAQRALAVFCQALLSSNRFLYVD